MFQPNYVPGTVLMAVLGLVLAAIGVAIIVAPLFCWSHLSQINKKMDALVKAAAQPTLSATGIADALAKSMREDDVPLVSTTEPRERTIVCDQCGKAIKIPAISRLKPGDTAHCPGCKAMIRV